MGDTWDTRAELAGREGLALLFHAEEGGETHGIPELSWRGGRGWPYYFLQREGGRHTGNTGSPAAIGRGGLLLFLAEGEEGEGVRRTGWGIEI